MTDKAKSGALKMVLTTLAATNQDVEACAVITTDGLIVASNFPPGTDEERMGATAAALVAMGERASSDLARGALQQVFIRGQQGLVVLMAAGDDNVLAVLCAANTKLGPLFADTERALRELSKLA